MLLCLGAASFGHGAIDVYQFDSEAQREQYQSLTKLLRCPKCQNQDIADSNAPIADMRREVHRLVLAGQTEEQVVQYMVDRFDEFVTYRPRVSASTYVLWYGPWVLTVAGVILVVLLASRRRRKSVSEVAEAPTALSAEQKQRLDALIHRYDEGRQGDASHSEPGAQQ
jgi:cytochrome c-type biogenesis protein CcmH